MAQIPASENEFPLVTFAEGAAPSTPAAGLVVCYVKSDGLLYCKDDAGTETAYASAITDLAAHLADASDAHDASAISVLDTAAVFTGTDVEVVLKELYDAIAGGGISPTIFDAQGDLIVASAADTAARLALGASGEALTSNGTTAVWGRPKGALKDFAHTRYTGGDITLSADTTWTDVSGPSDLTLTAAAGDIIECGASLIAANTTAASCDFDFGTIVSAAVVNHVGGIGVVAGTPDATKFGPNAWRIHANVVSGFGGSVMYELVSGDITSGTVVLRLRYIVEGSTNRVINATTARPIHLWAKNLGPAI